MIITDDRPEETDSVLLVKKMVPLTWGDKRPKHTCRRLNYFAHEQLAVRFIEELDFDYEAVDG